LTPEAPSAKTYPIIVIDEYNGLARYVETLNILGDESRLRLCALILTSAS